MDCPPSENQSSNAFFDHQNPLPGTSGGVWRGGRLLGIEMKVFYQRKRDWEKWEGNGGMENNYERRLWI